MGEGCLDPQDRQRPGSCSCLKLQTHADHLALLFAGVPQTNFGLGYSVFQWVFSLGGAALVERVGRRKLMLFSMGGCTYTTKGSFNHMAAACVITSR